MTPTVEQLQLLAPVYNEIAERIEAIIGSWRAVNIESKRYYKLHSWKFFRHSMEPGYYISTQLYHTNGADSTYVDIPFEVFVGGPDYWRNYWLEEKAGYEAETLRIHQETLRNAQAKREREERAQYERLKAKYEKA